MGRVEKPKVFHLHFNRFNARRGSKDAWTVHTGGKCLFARQVNVRVPVVTIYKGDDAPQPRAFLKGVGIVIVKRGGKVEIR